MNRNSQRPALGRGQGHSLATDRRGFLTGLGALAGFGLTSRILPGLTGQALAQASGAPFVLYIHCGSWDGLAGSLIQPTDVGSWARGLFRSGMNGGSVNPHINTHLKSGNLVFNGYSRVLAPIAQDMLYCVGNAQSAGHEQARHIQSTGSNVLGAAGNSSWPVQAAQAFGERRLGSAIAVSQGGTGSATTGATSSVLLVSAENVSAFARSFNDNSHFVRGAAATSLTSVLKERFAEDHVPGFVQGDQQAQLGLAVDSLLRGVPELAPGSAVLTGLAETFSQSRFDGVFTGHDEAAALKAQAEGILGMSEALRRRLTLAAALISTRAATGMTIDLDNEDRHDGGSSVVTARKGAVLAGWLRLFWEWVVSQGAQDRVLVIVSHEFTRTAYNSKSMPGSITYQGQPVQVAAPGTDHHPVIGMIFLNGNVPPASRLGGIADGFNATGSVDLRGLPSSTERAYTSHQLVGSMLLRTYPEVFPNARTLRQVCPNFRDTDQIALLMR